MPLLVAAVALVILPYALDFAGLPLRSSIDVVVFAIACMGLNILVGHTGLVSFGHGAWFGLGAPVPQTPRPALLVSRQRYSAGIVPTIVLWAFAQFLSGALILRRRGVYFSLLTLALTALLMTPSPISQLR